MQSSKHADVSEFFSSLLLGALFPEDAALSTVFTDKSPQGYAKTDAASF